MNDRLIEIMARLQHSELIFIRAGDILKEILDKPGDIISGEDSLRIYNSYGIGVNYLNLFLLSHGKEMDVNSFAKLLFDQEEESKRCIKC
jgi:alanyl-tRNA synthetase